MAYEANFETSNRETFAFELSALNIDTGEDFDFTGGEVAFAITDNGCSRDLSAEIDDGVVLVTPTVLSVQFTPEKMYQLTKGTHRVGMIFRRDDLTVQMLVGTVSVYDGIAKL